MAITLTWPLTSDGAGAVTYTANDWRTLLTSLFSEGILGESSFDVSERAAGASMKLDMTAGLGVLEGDDTAGQGHYLVEATETLEAFTISTADPSNPRIDLVGIQLNDPSEGGAAGRNCTLVTVTGTAAASPVAPTAPDSFLELAQVTVPAGATSIANANITDTRTLANLTYQAQIGDITATGDTLVRRTSDGRFGAADPTSALNVANKQWTEALVAVASGTVGQVSYARVGKLVHVWTTGDTAGEETIPAGFRPTANVQCAGVGSGTAGGGWEPVSVSISTAGVIQHDANVAVDGAAFAVSYLIP